MAHGCMAVDIFSKVNISTHHIYNLLESLFILCQIIQKYICYTFCDFTSKEIHFLNRNIMHYASAWENHFLKNVKIRNDWVHARICMCFYIDREHFNNIKCFKIGILSLKTSTGTIFFFIINLHKEFVKIYLDYIRILTILWKT